MRVQPVLIPNENACVHLHLTLCALMNINSSYCRVLVQKLRARERHAKPAAERAGRCARMQLHGSERPARGVRP